MRRFARTRGAALLGASARLVDVQAAVHGADDDPEPGPFRIVGLPDVAMREGRERIRTAVQHLGWSWPGGHVTVNLAPAATRKEGAGLDLPMALAILAAWGALGPAEASRDVLAVGELGLDGSVRPVRGVLAAAEAARRGGVRAALVPVRNAAEAAAVDGLRVHGVRTLAEAAAHLAGTGTCPVEPPVPWEPAPPSEVRLAAVRGQATARRAALIAAAGGHNLLLEGPPGAGKTLLARALVDLMPPLARAEALEVSRVHSVAGLLEGGLVTRRPFRAPHHTTSLPGLVGGGTLPRPGEVSLAHAGVLFLDEMAELPRTHLEALRQPVEDGRIVVGRAAGRAAFPSRVLLVGAMNPCPCGWLGVEARCRCRGTDVARYRRRLSGPLRDRFDLHVVVRPVDPGALVGPRAEEDVEPVRAALERAWAQQRERAARLGLASPFNARLPGARLPRAAEATPEAEVVLLGAAGRLGLSARGVHRVLRVARTIADLAGEALVGPEPVHEAVSLRGTP